MVMWLVCVRLLFNNLPNFISLFFLQKEYLPLQRHLRPSQRQETEQGGGRQIQRLDERVWRWHSEAMDHVELNVACKRGGQQDSSEFVCHFTNDSNPAEVSACN